MKLPTITENFIKLCKGYAIDGRLFLEFGFKNSVFQFWGTTFLPRHRWSEIWRGGIDLNFTPNRYRTVDPAVRKTSKSPREYIYIPHSQ